MYSGRWPGWSVWGGVGLFPLEDGNAVIGVAVGFVRFGWGLKRRVTVLT